MEVGTGELATIGNCTAHMDAAACRLDVQSLMEIKIFDCVGGDSSRGSCQNDNSDTDYSEETNEFTYPRKSTMDGRKLRQLLREYTIFCRVFLSKASCPRCQKDKEALAYLLSRLNKIWTQAEMLVSLACLFCYDRFRRDVLKIVKFFEKELKKCREETSRTHQIGQISYSTLIYLVPSIIPLVLKLLRAVHALWKDDARVTLPEELAEAKSMQSSAQISCLSEDIVKLRHADVAELKENELGQWLQLIRESGYNFLGSCAPIQRAFYELLDSSSINDAIVENLRYMEFRHLSKLIDLVLIPLVKYCPRELWGEWILKLLPPLFSYCEDILCEAWFNLLNKGRAGLPHYFGYLRESEESVKKLEDFLLLDLTRKVSKLLGVLASPELNADVPYVDLQPVNTTKTASTCDLKCISSNSVIRYILLNDCFGKLNMNLLGSWVDGEATIDAVPFCHALLQVAVTTNNGQLRQFIVDDMLPATIKRLCDDLPCAVQQTIRKLSCHLNSSKRKKASSDLLVLSEEIYKVYIQSQDFADEDPDNKSISDRFEDWFARQKEELRVKASYAIPVDFPFNSWNWEFEDEFRRYLPTYIDMLYEVDAMDDCLEYDYLESEMLFEKLRPEFRSKHGINSCVDRHVNMILKMIQRKEYAEYFKRRFHQMDKWLCKLITSKPYLKHSHKRDGAMGRLMENFVITKDFRLDAEDAVDMFYCPILFYLEPQFHPLIREGQKDFLIKIAHQLIFAEEAKRYQPLEPESGDFLGHLQPFASSYIYRKKKESGYFEAREQVQLHQEFDKYLASGKLDDDIYKFRSSQDKSVQKFADKHIVNSRFKKLDHKLITLSLEQRAQIVDTQRQIDTYCEFLRDIVANEELKDCLKVLMNELEEEGFFDVDNDSINWGKTCFVPPIDKFEDLAFKGHSCPKYVVIRGIMEYWIISQRSDIITQDAFEKVVQVVCRTWKENIAELWMGTRYYEESCYDILRHPLKKVFPRKDELQNYDKKHAMVG